MIVPGISAIGDNLAASSSLEAARVPGQCGRVDVDVGMRRPWHGRH
jgi:hypothetical protein